MVQGVAAGSAWVDGVMGSYQYQAKDRSGNTHRGSVQAESEAAAAKELRSRGLYPTSVTPEGAPGRVAGSRPVAGREGILARMFPPVSLSQRLLFWRQLQSLQRSGVSISESLREIASMMRGHFARVIATMANQTSSGNTLSEELEKYPATFPGAEVAMIRASEHTGNLDQAIDAIAELNEREVQARREFTFQLFYPAIVILGLIFVPILPTLVLKGFAPAANMFVDAYVPALIVILAILLGLRMLLVTSQPARVVYDHIKLKTPGIGAIASRLTSAKLASLIAAGYRAGLDIALSVELAAKACGNAALEKAVLKAVPHIRQGASLTEALGSVRVLPRRAMQMLATGERTGGVDDLMERVAGYFRDEAYTYIRFAAVGIGVLALLIAGVLVLLFALQFYTGQATDLLPGADGP